MYQYLVFEVISGKMSLDEANKQHAIHSREVASQNVKLAEQHKSWLRFPGMVRDWLRCGVITEAQANEIMRLQRRRPALPIKLLKRVVLGFMTYEQALKSHMPVIRAEQAARDAKRFDRETMMKMMTHGSQEHNRGVSDIYGNVKKLKPIMLPQGAPRD